MGNESQHPAEKNGDLQAREETSTSPAKQAPKLSWKWSLMILILFFASLFYFVHIIRTAINTPTSNSRPSLVRDREHVKKAIKILSENPLIDGHNDLAILARALYKNRIYDDPFKKQWEKGGLIGHVDVPRIKKGRYGGAFWSAFLPCPKDVNDFSDENYAPSD